MIKTVTLNPAVDKAVTIAEFAVGEVNRIVSVRLDAGGKGINVARVLHRLGAPALALAPVGGAAGQFLAGRLDEEGIPCRLLKISGESRTNLKVVDPVLGTHTDINEPGTPLSERELDRLRHDLLDDLGPGDAVVFSGSVPAGVPSDLYGTWIAEASSRGAFTVLDAEGALFSKGLQGAPDLVKPNRAELEVWAGRRLDTDDALLEAMKLLRSSGARTVAVSLGSQGAWLATENGFWFAPGLKVEAQSTVGAGDAFVAALTWALVRRQSPQEALAAAVATATASVVRPGTGAGELGDIEKFRAQLAVRQVSFSGRKP